MTKFFIVLAILLILTGTLLIVVPRDAPSMVSRAPAQVTFIAKARDIAEQVNAPLSILFGLISLFYSRRTYLAQSKR